MVEQGKILQQRYRIDRQIGQGGMGAVYVATDERFGSLVAIKETLFLDETFQKAIEREARLLNSLKHPGLPRVSDHFSEDNTQFLVMEYIPGDDLVAMLERMGRPFSFALVLHWADQLLDALEYLHGQQMPVVHRDIKPHNLKITPQGQVILLDFGLAKGNPTDSSINTAAKSVFGYSRNYASLEQIQGTGTDPRSDLYSLAATLYHLATGQPPVDALTRAMRVLGRQPDPMIAPHLLRDEIPVGFSGVLNAAMDLDAESRPRTARQMRQMLKSLEKFEHLAAVAAPAAPYVTNGSIEVETQLKQGATQPQSGVSTEVLPANLSQATALRSGIPLNDDARETVARQAVPAQRRFRRGHAIAAACAAVLFIVCTVAAGAIYFVPSGLFGSGSTAGRGQGQGAPGGGAADPLESRGGTEGRPANPSSQDQPSHGPAAPQPQTAEPARPVQQEQPDQEPEPAPRVPAEPETARTRPPVAEPKSKKPGVRVDSIEIDRLPGGFRGIKVTRGRDSKKPNSDDDDDDGGIKITRLPGIFRKIPSQLRELGKKDQPKKRVVTRQ